MAEMHQGTLVVTRPPHYPTPWSREQVQFMVAFGLTEQEIALVIRATVPELREHYTEELENGLARVNASVQQALLSKALYEGDVQAMKLWLMNKAGWKGGDGPRALNNPGHNSDEDGETITVVQRREIIGKVLQIATREVRTREKTINGTVVATSAPTQKANGSNGASHGANGNGAHKSNGNGNGSGHT